MNTRTPTGQGISAHSAPKPCAFSMLGNPRFIIFVLILSISRHIFHGIYCQHGERIKKRARHIHDWRSVAYGHLHRRILSGGETEMNLRRAVLLSSNAEGCTKLNAFDNALLNAGIGNANLVRLSSVVPENVEWLNNVPDFPMGTVLFAVYSHIESDEEGARISAAVGVGIRSSKEMFFHGDCSESSGIHSSGGAGGGLIYEFSGFCDAEYAAGKVKEMLSEGFAVRDWKISEIKVAVAEHTVRKKPGCALAAVVFFP